MHDPVKIITLPPGSKAGAISGDAQSGTEDNMVSVSASSFVIFPKDDI